MGFETLVLLFIVFSVISSIVNRVQKYRRRQDQEEKSRPGGPFYEPTISRRKEIDLSDREVFAGSEPHEPGREEPEVEEAQEAPAPQAGEFREVRGAHRVEEPEGGREFRGVAGKRPVTEAHTGKEFREVRGKRPVTGAAAFEPVAIPAPLAPAEPLPKARGCRRRRRGRRWGEIRLDPHILRRAIAYQEILGPPRADHMPW